MKRRQVLTTLGIGAISGSRLVRAQAFGASDRTVRIILGFPAGGATDAIARIVAPHLEKPLNAKVIVENKPGAGARIANTYVKAAKPDGNTLLLTSSSLMAVYPHAYKNLGYDPLRDFVPVTSVVNMEFGYIASTAAAPKVTTLREYVQWVKANPLNGNYGAVGTGSIPHFLGFLLARAGGIQLNHVPFNGGAPHLQALNGGQIPFGIDVLAGIVPHLSTGRLRLLATSGTERSVPGVPTASEAGFPDLATEDYTGLFYPAATPNKFVQQVQGAVKSALQQPSVQESFRLLTFKPSGADSAQFTQRVNSDFYRWRKVVADSGFKPLD
ncbi:tripartite tricarboxylate transporter substrate-binding protein [Cupriavidus sp. YAF13]|uniref:tripartite tricarboxylate transporter substrate-binding protein n=1 Tax=Cupriavidus sp. YAF13 TaxID=3233075 RepID=UPI003F90F1D9